MSQPTSQQPKTPIHFCFNSEYLIKVKLTTTLKERDRDRKRVLFLSTNFHVNRIQGYTITSHGTSCTN